MLREGYAFNRFRKANMGMIYILIKEQIVFFARLSNLD